MYNVVHNAHCILRLSARSFSYMVQQDYAFSPLGLGIEPYQRRNFVLIRVLAWQQGWCGQGAPPIFEGIWGVRDWRISDQGLRRNPTVNQKGVDKGSYRRSVRAVLLFVHVLVLAPGVTLTIEVPAKAEVFATNLGAHCRGAFLHHGCDGGMTAIFAALDQPSFHMWIGDLGWCSWDSHSSRLPRSYWCRRNRSQTPQGAAAAANRAWHGATPTRAHQVRLEHHGPRTKYKRKRPLQWCIQKWELPNESWVGSFVWAGTQK